MSKRIGIFAGSFDPIHKGHLTIALQAIQHANLDFVYFLPEIKPRRKQNITHISHRLVMLQLAVKPYSKIGILEFPDIKFSVAKTLPKLKQRFLGDEIFFIMGADTELENLAKWPLIDRLLSSTGLIIASRGKTKTEIKSLIKKLTTDPQTLYVLDLDTGKYSSAKIRQAIASGQKPIYVLPSIKKYIDANWLYSVVPNNSE